MEECPNLNFPINLNNDTNTFFIILTIVKSKSKVSAHKTLGTHHITNSRIAVDQSQFNG